jgi:hypothetical protein
VILRVAYVVAVARLLATHFTFYRHPFILPRPFT